MRFHACLFLSILLDVYHTVILARPCMYFFCTTIPVILVFIYPIDFPLNARSVVDSQPCHVLNPMRPLSRIPLVIVRPLPLYSARFCIISRPLSSFDASNANARLNSPAINHILRFDWRLHAPSPRPPLSTEQTVLAKRTQPPLPTDAYPYNAHIQNYKDQYVTHRVSPLPIYCSPYPAVSSPSYRSSVHRTKLSLENASRVGA